MHATGPHSFHQYILIPYLPLQCILLLGTVKAQCSYSPFVSHNYVVGSGDGRCGGSGRIRILPFLLAHKLIYCFTVLFHGFFLHSVQS